MYRDHVISVAPLMLKGEVDLTFKNGQLKHVSVGKCIFPSNISLYKFHDYPLCKVDTTWALKIQRDTLYIHTAIIHYIDNPLKMQYNCTLQSIRDNQFRAEGNESETRLRSELVYPLYFEEYNCTTPPAEKLYNEYSLTYIQRAHQLIEEGMPSPA